MARGVAKLYKEPDNQVTLLFFVDGVLTSSQINLTNWGAALSAVTSLAASLPGAITEVTMSITSDG